MPAQGTRKAHSDAPGADAVKATKRALAGPRREFPIPEEALAHFRRGRARRAAEGEWNALVESYGGSTPTSVARGARR